jgi:hypothetical protein
LSVEVDLSADDVAEYAEANGYDAIRFAVMTPELLAAFVDEFGTTVANPPATPKIVVDATGVAGEMTTGFESVDDLVKVLTDAGPPLATATSSPEPAQASSSPTTEP